MATDYEGIDTFAIAEMEYESFEDCGCVSVGAIEDVVRGVLARLQADGRLITGEVETEYGVKRTDHEGEIHYHPRPDREWAESSAADWKRSGLATSEAVVVQRTFYVSGWQPVSDIGNDQGDNDG